MTTEHDAAGSGPCQLCPARLAQGATQLLGAGFNEIVPPEAQRHLLNAQRELLLAAMVTIQHNTSRGTPTPTPRGRTRKAASPKRTRQPSRVEID